MTLYCIVRAKNDISNPDTYRLLKEAAHKQNVVFETLEANNFDYAGGIDQLNKDAIVYRLAQGSRAALLEVLLVNFGMKGLYSSVDTLLTRNFAWGSAIRMEHAGVPIIPTIYNVSKNEDPKLADYVQKLGGFPIIIKSSGGSHGEGVMKVDSISSLRSVIGYISTKDSNVFVLRSFIRSARHLRLIVLGDSVIDTIEYQAQNDDFRTNAVKVPNVVARNDVDEATKQIAVKAVKALGLQFGGVDILCAEDGTQYVAEVNFPCNFARNQMNTGTDIAGSMIDYLKGKAEHHA